MKKPCIFLSGYKTKNYRIAFESVGFDVSETERSSDALCLCGGGDISPCAYGQVSEASKNIDLMRDQREFYYLKKFIDSDRPVFAVCRGLQIVNVYFGGTLCQNIDGHDQKGGKDTFHRAYFYGELKSIFGNFGFVNSAHHQAIGRLGDGLKVTAVSEDGIIEAVTSGRVHAYQFHPERAVKGTFAGEKIVESFFKKYFC